MTVEIPDDVPEELLHAAIRALVPLVDANPGAEVQIERAAEGDINVRFVEGADHHERVRLTTEEA